MSAANGQLSLEDENRRLKRAVEELSVLNELARAIGAARDSEEIMHTIVRRSLRAVHAEQGVITLVESTSGTSGHTLLRTNVSSTSHPQFQSPQALLGWMHLNRKPLAINDPPHDKRFQGISWGAEIRSVLCVPLTVKSELIGTLTVYNKAEAEGFSPDDQRLLAIIAAQSAQVIENARLYEEEKAYLQMQHDVQMASRIQSDLLPKIAPQLPGYEILGVTTPARVVGGDYYDFITLDDNRFVFCLGDVSGKGLPASLLMANLQATIRGQSFISTSPSDCMQRSNKLLFHSTSPEKFATLFYGALDCTRHILSYCNAGHEHPLRISRDGSVTTLETGGLMLGAFEDFPFEQGEVLLQPGDLLVVLSDGITEAMNAAGDLFGVERLKPLLLDGRSLPIDSLVEKVFCAVHDHVNGAPQSDDITLLLVRRTS